MNYKINKWVVFLVKESGLISSMGEKRQRNVSVFTEISDTEGLMSVSVKVVSYITPVSKQRSFSTCRRRIDKY